MTIDEALRAFLLPFRLPGEAQKIDRLMEAFAERYVRDNPAAFRNADAAYVLSFAVIMLNTDAHNPLAERRLDKAAFVAMTTLPVTPQDDGGGGGVVGAASAAIGVGTYEPALPVPELEGIYDRIVANEIVVRGNAPGATVGGKGKKGPGGNSNKLAAALGLRILTAPFRIFGAGGDKAVSDEERRRQQMMEVAELAVVRGSAGGAGGPASPRAGGLANLWHTCTHAQHTRPMLLVSGNALLEALVAALQRATDATAVEGITSALVTVAELAGLMGLEVLCESTVGALAAAASVLAPAPFGTFAAARQLAALRALLRATASPEAGQLGSAWAIILRTTSELEALVRAVTRPLQPGEANVAFMSSSQVGGGRDGGV